MSNNPVMPQRAGGILLHPTSLPGPYAIGDLGPSAIAWLDWLAVAGCSLWQILPLGPTGYADSPYQSFSAFAGNQLLISPDLLIEQELLVANEVEESPSFTEQRVSYGEVIPWKEALLDHVADGFLSRASPDLLDGFRAYCDEHQSWLEDFALFMALKGEYDSKPWTDWPETLRDRETAALQLARQSLSAQIHAQKVRQYLFTTQWISLREAAHQRGITIIGDIPIFVAHDSVDVWSHRELYFLDTAGLPLVVAGVPPDYFSSTGQRWGNPLYNWARMADQDYAWWVARLQQILRYVDVVRLDHFRGFEGYWEIPAYEETAIQGRWVPGPGHALLNRLQEAMGGLPLIAEDLGVITPEVIGLRKDFNLPGMKVLQFGFEGGPDEAFLPHLHEEACVAYTGTHDNDTTTGWYEKVSHEVQEFCRQYLVSDGQHIAWDMLEALWGSVASWVITPIQDPLELGSEARMNFPSRTHGNWDWRVKQDQLTEGLAKRLLELNQRHGRLPN